MEKTQKTAVKWGLAAASALALTFGGIAPAAFAADIPLGPSDIANFEDGTAGSPTFNYTQWHVGSNSNPDYPLDQSLSFGECSVTTLAHPNIQGGSVVQVLKGFDSRPFVALPAYDGDGTIAAATALFDTIEITVLTGNVTIQIPMFEYDGLDAEPRTPQFTTVRSVLLGPGTHKLSDYSVEDSQGWFGGSTLTWAGFISGLQDNVDDDFYYEILGVGFTGSEGAQVSQLSFGGNTYYFGTGSCLPTNPTPPDMVDTAA